MPQAEPPTPPCKLAQEQASFVRESAQRIFGSDVVLRNYGTDPKALRIHVEADACDLAVTDFIGVLITRLDHIPSVSVTKRGARARGDAKVAYRQGDVL